MAQTLTTTDLQNLLLGACLFGGGGGGPISGAQPLIDYMTQKGLQTTLYTIDELPATNPAAVVAGIGAPDAATHGPAFTEAPQQAFQQLGGVTGVKPTAVLPGETGAMNSMIPALVAAQLGLPLVDVDSSGRALPTLNLAAYNLAVMPTPLVLTNQTSDPQNTVQAVLQTPTAQGQDDLVRGLVTASAFGDEGAFASWELQIGQLPGACVQNTVSRSIAVGAALQQAMSSGSNPVAAINALLGGTVTVLATGPITSITTQETGGFDVSKISVADQSGATITVMAINENLLAWSSESAQPLAAAPDTIAWMTVQGMPLSNADISESTVGTQVYLLGIPAAPILFTPYLLQGFQEELAQVGYMGEAPRLPSLKVKGMQV